MWPNKWLYFLICFHLLLVKFVKNERLSIQNESNLNLPAVENEEEIDDDPLKSGNITCGIRNNYEFNRILGGTIAQFGEFPWLVSIQNYGNRPNHLCGGAIVAPKWILTAGHCVHSQNKENLRVVAGEYRLNILDGTEQFRKVSDIILHSDGINSLFAHDIALLKLMTNLIFDPRSVAPICLPKKDEEFQGTATISGWGKQTEANKSSILRSANIHFVSSKRCRRVHGRIGIDNYFNGCQICAGEQKGGVDACQGDSGGPLICRNIKNKRYYICGIVSWGVGCGNPAYPGVYTKVSCYTDWILNTISNSNDQ